MGREIRRVPPHWEHPKKSVPDWRTGQMVEQYQPLYDNNVESAWEEWQKGYAEWLAGEHDRVRAKYGEDGYQKDQPYRAYCEWSGRPPDPEYYRPKWAEGEASWWQAYDNVSEGTPVSPPFETQEELIEYLCANGDFWAQNRGEKPPSRAAVEAFVKGGYVPSMMVTRTETSVVIKEGIECAAPD